MSKPKVVVLMATYNGMEWIEEQVNSILNQQNVTVRLLVSDDNSTDGTYEWLNALSEHEDRVTLLPRTTNEQLGAGGNFYHLLRHVEFNDAFFYALSDQDDVWYPTKLHEQCRILVEQNVDATSSNVDAFWSDGRKHLINKSQQQRKFDYFFESAGPGCSYCFNANVLKLIKEQLQKLRPEMLLKLHDWFIYALCRANNYNWLIYSKPLLAYRQHGHNEVGAHTGMVASLSRLKSVYCGDFRQEVSKLAFILNQLANSDTRHICQRLTRLSVSDRWFLLTHVHQLRRKKKDSLALAILIISCLY